LLFGYGWLHSVDMVVAFTYGPGPERGGALPGALVLSSGISLACCWGSGSQHVGSGNDEFLCYSQPRTGEVVVLILE